MLGNDFELSLVQNIDIVDSINKEGIIAVGFKAEMDEVNAISNASKMIDNKSVDAVCLNILKDSSSFGCDTNKIEFITPNKKESLKEGDKLTLSFDILTHAKELSA